jgi:hypothetical protein
VRGASRGLCPTPVTPRPAGLWWKAPGPPAIPPRAAALCHGDWHHHPRSSRRSAGRPRSGGVNATDDAWHQVNMPTSSPGLWPVRGWAVCGPWPKRCRGPRQATRPMALSPLTQQVCPRAWAEAPPRGGVTLDGVTRPFGHTRASSAAGPRRTPVRWSPTHGYQPEQPSHVTGSGSSDARR